MIYFPDKTEYAPFYETYVGKVPKGDLLEQLEAASKSLTTLLEDISEEQWDQRYQPGKWSIKELILHINDTERVMSYRAFWIARNSKSPLVGFDQDEFVKCSDAANRSKRSLIDEFTTIRAATLSLLKGMSTEMWTRSGIASDHPVSVRALACIILGHQIHHVGVLKDKYL